MKKIILINILLAVCIANSLRAQGSHINWAQGNLSNNEIGASQIETDGAGLRHLSGQAFRI